MGSWYTALVAGGECNLRASFRHPRPLPTASPTQRTRLEQPAPSPPSLGWGKRGVDQTVRCLPSAATTDSDVFRRSTQCHPLWSRARAHVSQCVRKQDRRSGPNLGPPSNLGLQAEPLLFESRTTRPRAVVLILGSGAAELNRGGGGDPRVGVQLTVN